MNRFKVTDLLEKYRSGINIIDYLKDMLKIQTNTPEIISLSYDLQAGSYIEYTLENEERAINFAIWVADVLHKYAPEMKTYLDAGTGELTTLKYVLEELSKKDISPDKAFAFDISWSRIFAGKNWMRSLNCDLSKLSLFCADINQIPLPDSSLDVVSTFHALEPNGGNERALLLELKRVSKGKVIVFEPSYENNSDEGKARMDRLGYIKNIPSIVKSLGGEVVDVQMCPCPANFLNPTAAYIISFSKESVSKDTDLVSYSEPGTSSTLRNDGDSYYSPEYGTSFPIVSGIPMLLTRYSILTTYKRNI